MSPALKPYPVYKDSGVPWLGKLPAQWDIRRGKFFFREIDERSETGEEELLSVSHKTGVTPRSQKNVTMFMAESYTGHKLCRPGDIVINTMWAWMAALGVSNYAGIVSPSYGVYRQLEKDNINSIFLDNLLRTPQYSSEYVCRSTGVNSSRLRLYPEDFLDIPIICPPANEQQQIVSFLQATYYRIRRFIRAKRRLIELLNEEKQAIINRAVTRGLEPHVRMKPSGIEWLGEVPEHWNVKRLKMLVTEAVAGPYGSSLTKAMYTSQGYRVYGQQQVIPDDFTVGDYFISEEKFAEMQRYQVYPGDVLISVMGTVGRVAVVPESVEPGIINPRLVRYKPDTKQVLARYLQLAIQSVPVQVQLNEAAKGTTMAGLNMQIIGKLMLSIPPLNEQADILNELHTSTDGLASMVDRVKREIDLIREYRTRLIADVVTGKLDVRDVELPDAIALSEIDDSLDNDEQVFEDEPAPKSEENGEEEGS
ncbi:MAG: restriction endonuclease subunit S [Armatimonadota bacterium]